MKTSKKSDVGLAKVSTQLNGENRMANNALNVTIVVFCLPMEINL